MEVKPFGADDLIPFPDLTEEMRAEGITQVYGPAFTARDEHGIVAIGGLVRMGGGTCEAWFHCRKKLNGAGQELVWTTRRMLREQMREHGWHRAQARIQPTNAAAVRFIRAMGFSKEATMQAYWYREDRDLYAMVIP